MSVVEVYFSTYQKLFNTGDNVDFLIIAGYDNIDIVEVEKRVKSILKERLISLIYFLNFLKGSRLTNTELYKSKAKSI